MQEHTKKPHTEAISMTFTGPVAMLQTAIEAMQQLGFQEEQRHPAQSVEGSIPWREIGRASCRERV